MSCKDEAEKEGDALQRPTKTALAQVNGAATCVRPGCGKPLDQASECPRGHSQQGPALSAQAVPHIQSLLGALDALDAEGGWVGSTRAGLLAEYALAMAEGRSVADCWVAQYRDEDGYPRGQELLHGSQEEAQHYAQQQWGQEGLYITTPLERYCLPMLAEAELERGIGVAALVRLVGLSDSFPVGQLPRLPDDHPALVAARQFLAQVPPYKAAAATESRLGRAVALAQSSLDRDPGLAAYILRDLPETAMAGLRSLAWRLSSDGEYVHKNDVLGLIDMLTTAVRKRLGPQGLAGPRSHYNRPVQRPMGARPRRWSNRVLFVSRDVLAPPAGIERRAGQPSEVQLDPEALRVVETALQGGATVVIVGNQPEVGVDLDGGGGSSYFTEDDLMMENQGILDALATSPDGRVQLYYCPHAPGAGCACRLPRLGQAGGTAQLQEALAELGMADAGPEQCLYLGAGPEDLQAANNAGIPLVEPTGAAGLGPWEATNEL